MKKRVSPGLAAIVAILLLSMAIVPGASARGPTIDDIQNGDTIYLYETGLDISALRDGAPENVASLVQYINAVPGSSRNVIDVNDDTNFDVLSFLVNGYYGLYYANNQTGLIANSGTQNVNIQEPTVSIQTVLAPGHQLVEGFSISNQNNISFRVSNNVATGFRVGGNYLANISIVVTEPGGSETYRFGGANLQNLNVDSSQFYTDDKTAECALNNLQPGTYRAYAEWSNAPFRDNAPNSNTITFEVKGRVDFPATTVTTTPAVTVTTATPTSTPAPTPTPTVTKTTIPTTMPPTTLPQTIPTPMNPLTALSGVILVIALGMLLGRR